MKLFKVGFRSGKEEEVQADRWEIHDGSYLFFEENRALDGISFPEEAVEFINVLSQDVERDFRPRGGGSY